MMKADKYKVGELKLGDKVYVSDPAYSPGIWCQALIGDIKPGKYIGYIYKSNLEDWGRRVIDILIIHEDYPDSYPTKKFEDVEIGVDSAKAGIFEYEFFEDINENTTKKDELFNLMHDLFVSYDVYGNRIRERISSKRASQNKEPQEPMDAAVIFGKCIISDSGLGDGGYDLYYSDNEEGEIVALRLNFIREES